MRARMPVVVPRTTHPLTHRQAQVLLWVAFGHTNAEVGEKLGVSEDTVKTTLRTVLRKLDANDRAHAVTRAFQLGIFRVETSDGAP